MTKIKTSYIMPKMIDAQIVIMLVVHAGNFLSEVVCLKSGLKYLQAMQEARCVIK